MCQRKEKVLTDVHLSLTSPQSRPQTPLFFWSAPRTQTLATSKAGGQSPCSWLLTKRTADSGDKIGFPIEEARKAWHCAC